MAKTNWDPYSGEPPPAPPPPRSLVNRNTKPLAPLPPPPSRTSSVASRSLSSSSSASSAPPLPSRGPPSGPPPPPPRGTAPPPAPPAIRSSPSLQITNGPPPIVRSTRPDNHARPETPKPLSPSSETEIDWSNLSPEDKKIFFNWLDEFFARFTPPSVPRDAAAAHRPVITASSHAPQPQSSVSILTHILTTKLKNSILQTKPTSWNPGPVGST
jgi:hypothetical protein